MEQLYLREEPYECPLSMGQIKSRFPNVSWELDRFEPPEGYFTINRVAMPTANFNQYVVDGEPVKIDGLYYQSWIVNTLTEPQLEGKIANKKQQLKEQSTAKRKEIAAAGIVLNGTRIGTTIEDQNRISSLISSAQLAGISTVDFKGDSGWVTLSFAQLQNIAGAIALHVQECFSKGRAQHEEIDQLSGPEAVSTYNVQEIWNSEVGNV